VTTTLLIGLVGAALGAFFGGYREYWLERRREVARARAGARLIRHDLAHADGHLKEALDSGDWRRFWITQVEHWDEYHDLLAAHLDSDEWESVARAVDTLRHIEAEVVRADPPPTDAFRWAVSEAQRERMTEGCTEALRAYNALAKLADACVVDAIGQSGPIDQRTPV
jgi:hypothetical protein